MVEQLLTDTAPVTRQAVEAENTAPVTHIASDRLYDSEMRLDAGHYNAATIEVNRLLGASGLSLKRMGDVTGRIFIPPRFKRIYVDYEHGVPSCKEPTYPNSRQPTLGTFLISPTRKSCLNTSFNQDGC